jgi:hypothetical protein
MRKISFIAVDHNNNMPMVYGTDDINYAGDAAKINALINYL